VAGQIDHGAASIVIADPGSVTASEAEVSVLPAVTSSEPRRSATPFGIAVTLLVMRTDA